MKTEYKAREILDYAYACFNKTIDDNLNEIDYRKTKQYKDMLKEIIFMLEND